jgi:hypothetical protein
MESATMAKLSSATRITACLFAAAGCTAVLVFSPLLEVIAATPERSVFLTNRMPYSAFDELPQTRLRSGTSDLAVAFAPGSLDLPQERVQKWIQQRADIVAAYYGGFPVDSARILVIPVSGSGVRGGTAYGWRGAALKVQVGERATEEDLASDWILVHEMVHFAYPTLDTTHRWMTEGQATYIETVARVQAGDVDEATAWWELATQMPKGLPRLGDAGLDYTHTWGRTYWGGALFCLFADVEIRKRTSNRYGLQDALRAVVGAGGVITESNWPLREALRISDRAIGVPAMEELYDELRAQPGNLDLDKLWSDLGVRLGSTGVTFDDRAPLAAVRRAIMAPRDAKR